MRLDHPIFHGPLQPEIAIAPVKVPDNYRHYHAGRALPATLDGWVVQTGELGKTVDYGLVATPGGFEDTPDAEVISGGSNSKGPESVALGRHGNWFLWGFAGDPTQMTPSAQQVFLNALIWMKQFDGQVPAAAPAGGRRPARESVLDVIGFVEAYRDQPSVLDWVKGQIPAEVYAECGGDAAKLREWYGERMEQLYPTRMKRKLKGEVEYEQDVMAVDPILERLGVGNRSPELFAQLDWLLREPATAPGIVALKQELAEAVPNGDLAGALFDRYLPSDAPRTADELKRWIAERRDRLYWSDTYGYRWFVANQPLPERMVRRGVGVLAREVAGQ